MEQSVTALSGYIEVILLLQRSHFTNVLSQRYHSTSVCMKHAQLEV